MESNVGFVTACSMLNVFQMSTAEYDSLTNSSCIWLCPNCDLMNYCSSILDSTSLDLPNSLSYLLSSPSDQNLGNILTASPEINLHISRDNYSTPKQTKRSQAQYKHSKQAYNKPRLAKHVNISFLNINCQSLSAKRETFLQMINEKQPDVIIGTESWLTSNHNNSKYFPTDVYHVERRDRPDDPHGGIFIAAKLDLTLARETEVETDCEMLWCKIQVQGSKTLHVGSYYRPHAGDQNSLDELAKSLALLHPDHIVLLGGDFNFPGWDWDNKVIKSGCPYVQLHHQFEDFVNDQGLEQLIETPTKRDNTLDLMITNNPSRISQVRVLPGLSDHDCPLVELNI